MGSHIFSSWNGLKRGLQKIATEIKQHKEAMVQTAAFNNYIDIRVTKFNEALTKLEQAYEQTVFDINRINRKLFTDSLENTYREWRSPRVRSIPPKTSCDKVNAILQNDTKYRLIVESDERGTRAFYGAIQKVLSVMSEKKKLQDGEYFAQTETGTIRCTEFNGDTLGTMIQRTAQDLKK